MVLRLQRQSQPLFGASLGLCGKFGHPSWPVLAHTARVTAVRRVQDGATPFNVNRIEFWGAWCFPFQNTAAVASMLVLTPAVGADIDHSLISIAVVAGQAVEAS
jgi:hypothetical protein